MVLLAIALALLSEHTFQPLAFLATVFMLHDMYAPAWHGVVMAHDGPIWSLAVEWQFYLLLPVLALGLKELARRFNLRGVMLGLLGLVVGGLAIRCLAAVGHYQWGWQDPVLPLLYGFKGKYLEVFAVGMLGALVFTYLIESDRLSPVHRRFLGRWPQLPVLLPLGT